MNVHLLIHLDEGPTWWAESDDVPGFNASAESLAELRRRCMAALSEIVPEVADVTECLIGEHVTGVPYNPAPPMAGSLAESDRSVGAPARTVFVTS